MRIALFTDPHALYEPTKAVLDDIKKMGINKIISLGDNIGLGPNPYETLSIIMDSNVTTILGNGEEYIKLGIEPFKLYFTSTKEQGVNWTKEYLTNTQINYIYNSKHSITLLGKKSVALCHFPNDVRCDFTANSTWSFQNRHNYNKKGYEQFYYTNSNEQKQIFNNIKKIDHVNNESLGYYSASIDPLFNGNKVTMYDYILMGHTHFEIVENDSNTLYHSLKGLCLINANYVSYYVLTIDDKIFELKEINVGYDKNKMIKSIFNSTIPDKTIRKFLK